MSKIPENALGTLSQAEHSDLDGNKHSFAVHDDLHDDPGPVKTITTYLMSNSPELRDLQALRKQGWNNPEGDRFFQQQRRNADRPSKQTATFFYNLMCKIGEQMHGEMSAFKIVPNGDREPGILDLCMAPGGFLETALKHNPWAKAVAFSLPMVEGGHRCLLSETCRVEKYFVDITMLAADMGVTTIPPNHPEAGKFLPRHLSPERAFDLVLCDGQVLRTQELAPYRVQFEARRLTASQLLLGLERLRPGGTLIFLMHKVEAWRSVQILYMFSRFAKVALYKPTVGHAKRSSFYLVARDVQSDSPEALSAIDWWREAWRAATFQGGEGKGTEWQDGPWTVEQIIEDFGPELLRIGTPIWRTQARALADAPFIRGSAG